MDDKKLGCILRRNQDTLYGKQYAFRDIRSVSDYQKKVPLTFYHDYIPYIERIRNRESRVLTREPVLLLEPTGGSTSAKKWIPYTRGLQREFSAAIHAWLWNLNRHFPRLKYGQMYFSITPQGSRNEGIEGFNRDDEYIGGWMGKLVARKLCVPEQVKEIEDMELFWQTTIDCIKKARDLRLVSIWNPTFLLILLERAGMTGQKLFPRLELISCWADGNAVPLADRLARAFPGVPIQPKGLLATEGIMTIPVEGVGKRLTRSHFFEFIDRHEDIRLPHQLDKGETYEIVLTTSGGLYRYRIGDLVRYKGNLCFDFVGRTGNVSDYFGEKLNEVHVSKVLAGLGFALLVPEGDRYILYTESEPDGEAIDRALRENFHYDYCRRLGQLQEVKVVAVQNGPRQYIDNCVRFGMRLGDIKPTGLSNRQGWVFQ